MKDTKEKIALGAFKLFLESNYEKVTVSEIERAIGMTRGAIFYHVKNKEDLFKLVIDRFILNAQRLKNKVDLSNISTFEEFITRYLQGIKNTMERMKSLDVPNLYKGYFLLITQAGVYYPNFSKKLGAIISEEYDIWKEIIQMSVESGELREDVDIYSVITMFRSSFLGLSFEQSQFTGLDLSRLGSYYNYSYKLIKR